MKKIYLFFAFVVLIFCNGQELDSLKMKWFMVGLDSTRINMPLASKFENCTLSDQKNPKDGILGKGVFLVEEYILCQNNGERNFIFKVYNGKDSYYIPTKDIRINNTNLSIESIMRFMAELSPYEKAAYKNYLTQLLSDYQAQKELDRKFEDEQPLRESIDATLKNPLVIYDFSFPNEYSFIGFSVEVLNTSKKRIKYISFNVSGFNEVKDKIPTLRGDYNRTLRGVGPVEVNGSASWNFETIWTDNSFYSGTLNSVTVEYFDGTKRTFTKLGPMIMSDEERELFDKYTQ